MIKTIGVFLQEQLLGMRWLNQLVGNLLQAIGIDLESRMGASVQFFIYDIIKIFILLSVLIFSISYIPLFIGFTSAGLPLGVTFSFLISSPLVDLGSLVMLTGSFGSKVALAYVLVGLVLAVLGGTLIERLHLENDVEEFIRNAGRVDLESPQMSVRDRLSYAKTQVASTVRKVAPYVLVGVAIGALIHNFIPQAFVEELLGAEHWYSVPLATLIGIPMYADIFGTIPIAESLFAKGAGLGTVLSFMMGVTALSLPSMVMLRKAVKPRLLAVFFGVVVVGIMLIGFFFNAISVAF